MSKHAKKVTIALLALGAVAAMSACQTVKGLGKDVEYAGSKTEEKIIEAQNK
jgi:predicted small secreted protein